MFACAETCSPVASPAHGMQLSPVWTATSPGGVDDPDLAHRRQLVGPEQRRERVGRGVARGEAVEPVRAVGGLDHGLRRHRADARARPDAERADREPVRVHGRAVLAGLGVEGDDRVRPVAHERATIPG